MVKRSLQLLAVTLLLLLTASITMADESPDRARGGEFDPTPPLTNAGGATEGFDDITTLTGNGWAMTNNSNPLGVTGWFQGSDTVFSAHAGAPTAYIAANYNNTGTGGPNTISNWLLTPETEIQTGDQISFWTRTVAGSNWPDRLQVRMSLSGASTDVGTDENSVGDFTTLLLDINPTLSTGGYPETWTEFVITVAGVDTPTMGRIGFRYFVTDAGPSGANSNYFGIDTYTYIDFVPTDVQLSSFGTEGNVFGTITTIVAAVIVIAGLYVMVTRWQRIRQ